MLKHDKRAQLKHLFREFLSQFGISLWEAADGARVGAFPSNKCIQLTCCRLIRFAQKPSSCVVMLYEISGFNQAGLSREKFRVLRTVGKAGGWWRFSFVRAYNYAFVCCRERVVHKLQLTHKQNERVHKHARACLSRPTKSNETEHGIIFEEEHGKNMASRANNYPKKNNPPMNNSSRFMHRAGLWCPGQHFDRLQFRGFRFSPLSWALVCEGADVDVWRRQTRSSGLVFSSFECNSAAVESPLSEHPAIFSQFGTCP